MPKFGEKMNRKREKEDNLKEYLEDSNLLQEIKSEDNIDRQRNSSLKLQLQYSNQILQNTPLVAKKDNFHEGKVLKIVSIFER